MHLTTPEEMIQGTKHEKIYRTHLKAMYKDLRCLLDQYYEETEFIVEGTGKTRPPINRIELIENINKYLNTIEIFTSIGPHSYLKF